MDLTGRFPYASSRGNEYIMIFYHYDANAILAQPMKNRSAGEFVKAHNLLQTRLQHNTRKPTMIILDNEISNEFKQNLATQNISYQLVPPHIHRRNTAERAIRTFKNHFLAGLASVNP